MAFYSAQCLVRLSRQALPDHCEHIRTTDTVAACRRDAMGGQRHSA